MSAKEIKDDLSRDPAKFALENDPYTQEVHVVAQVRAYYELASMRFYDAICLPIEAELFEELSENLFDHLYDGLRITDGNGTKRFSSFVVRIANINISRT